MRDCPREPPHFLFPSSLEGERGATRDSAAARRMRGSPTLRTPTLQKVISGGQTGVDIAALRAAQWAHLPTGGWCPRGWRTESGPQPELQEFGLCEHESHRYPARTAANIRDSDGTLVIADKLDAGSRLTLELCAQMRKPCLHLKRAELSAGGSIARVTAWLRSFPCTVLNVAGNRESAAPGIERDAERFLRDLFAAVVNSET
jgi:hypothetical protein